ncbi:probable membrane-associated kinase regulator 2 [Rhododendron vialii]|uniref:probable membrane-associated kinase regulator 2 n=1 Tax=Rhododendron vialii TaxID=182163 RepID=UPI00265DB884|nr:probable membrane-associated kinase regulator 2 [Rhododendron vialii]
MDTFRFLKYWKTHGVFPVNACSTPRMTITSTIPTAVSHHHPSSTDISPEEDHKTKHETIVSTGDDDSDGEKERDEFFKFTEPIDLYFKANEESRSSAVKSAMKLRTLMWKLKKSKGDEAEKIEFDDSVLTTANQTQRKLMTAELRVKEVTKYEKLTQTPDSRRLVRTPSYQNKEEVTEFEKLAWTPSVLRLIRTLSYRNEEATKLEKLAWTPSALRLARAPSYRNEEEVTKFEKLAWTPSLLRLVRTPGYQKKEEVTKSEKQHISKESGPNQTRFSSDLVQKYIEKVKPMYIGASKRYNEKKVRLAAQLRIKSPRETRSGQSPPAMLYTRKSTAEKRRSRQHEMTEAPPRPVVLKNWKQGNLPARLRVGRKHVGKGRSASSGFTQEKMRDDSVLDKEDGIQSAILHCKRSLNGSRGISSVL